VETALADFRRFPQWMWRNTDVVAFLKWLRAHNDTVRSDAAQVGFYGLDLYSLNAWIDAVVGYLDTVDPGAACPDQQVRIAAGEELVDGKDIQPE
jgi:erythromycin esterase-like protein